MKISISFTGGGIDAVIGAAAFLAALGKYPEIEVEHVVGVSGGALGAAGFCSGGMLKAYDVLEFIRGIELVDYWDPIPPLRTILSIVKSPKRPRIRAYLKGDRIRSVVERLTARKNIEDCSTPFTIVTANLSKKRVQYHMSGSLVDALAASSAIPGLFPPVQINGDWHVDGGIVENVPAPRTANGLIVTTLSPHRYGVSDWEPTDLLDVVTRTAITSFEGRTGQWPVGVQVCRLGIPDVSIEDPGLARVAADMAVKAAHEFLGDDEWRKGFSS